MNDSVVNKVKKYFNICELVSPAVYNKFGETAWKFFDTELLETILCLREKILKVPLVCNNWKSGGNFSQRGFRENTCDIVSEKTKEGKLYCSAHCLGKGIDLSSAKMSASDMKKVIIANKKLLPYNCRIEGDAAPTWLHLDLMVNPGTKDKVTIF